MYIVLNQINVDNNKFILKSELKKIFETNSELSTKNIPPSKKVKFENNNNKSELNYNIQINENKIPNICINAPNLGMTVEENPK